MSEFTVSDIERILQTYSLEDIFHLNDLEEADVLYFLVTEKFVSLPKPQPL